MSYLNSFINMEVVIGTGNVQRVKENIPYYLVDALQGDFVSILHLPTHLILRITLENACHYYLNFIDKGMPAQAN